MIVYSLSSNPIFLADYERLKAVALNPARHAAANAHEHCEMVRRRARELALLNHCTEEEIATLDDLALVHDIGKIAGNANPEESVELLPKYGVTDESFTNLVKYHDTNLPWYSAAERGQPASDKAWNKLARKVNVRLLCLLMAADRVDCPGGWRANRPLVWFLEEIKRRSLIEGDLIIDDGPQMTVRAGNAVETSAGAVLIQGMGTAAQALLIRVRASGFELPKGHVEPDETEEAAALRELAEETGIASPVVIGPCVGALDYSFERDGVSIHKSVRYFLASPSETEPVQFGELPSGTRGRRWVAASELAGIRFVHDDVRPIVYRAFELTPHH